MSTTFHDNYADGVTDWEDSAMNKPHEQLDLAIGVLGQISIIDRDLATPPGSPSDRDTYIVATSGTGDWSGHDGEIAYYDNTHTAWKFATPREGWRVYINDEDIWLFYNGSAWVADPVLHQHVEADITDKIYIAGLMFPAKPDAGMKGIHVAAIAFSFVPNLPNSQAAADTAATSLTTFNLLKEEPGSSPITIGSVTFSAGSKIGNFTFPGTQNFAVGDKLKVIAPNPQDSTLADISITLKGSR
jgi:hypothetical protein